jgi:hypothetical protein
MEFHAILYFPMIVAGQYVWYVITPFCWFGVVFAHSLFARYFGFRRREEAAGFGPVLQNHTSVAQPLVRKRPIAK